MDMEQRKTITTEEAAAQLHIAPSTLLTRNNKMGSYFGIVPLKPTNRLLWPADIVEQLSGVRRVRGRKPGPKVAPKHPGHRWAKGTTGNPSGRPTKEKAKAKAEARAKVKGAVA
jgi:hypothetical protein